MLSSHGKSTVESSRKKKFNRHREIQSMSSIVESWVSYVCSNKKYILYADKRQDRIWWRFELDKLQLEFLFMKNDWLYYEPNGRRRLQTEQLFFLESNLSVMTQKKKNTNVRQSVNTIENTCGRDIVVGRPTREMKRQVRRRFLAAQHKNQLQWSSLV